jgi:hypothetical protein
MKRYVEAIKEIGLGSVFWSGVPANGNTAKGTIVVPFGWFVVLSQPELQFENGYPDPFLRMLALWDGKVLYFSFTPGFIYEVKDENGKYVL